MLIARSRRVHSAASTPKLSRDRFALSFSQYRPHWHQKYRLGQDLERGAPDQSSVAEGLTDEEKQKINFFARTEYKNRMAIFGIKNGEDRRRHVYILGKSGTGKSTLIANMAIADIRNRAVSPSSTPHGDLSDILLDFIPSYRVNDVAYLDPSTKETSFHLNPSLRQKSRAPRTGCLGIVGIFYKLYGNSWGPRLEYLLRNAVLTLVQKQGSTLVDVIRILTDKNSETDSWNQLTTRF